MTRPVFVRIVMACLMIGLCAILICGAAFAVPYLDNQTLYSNQDPETETRRSDHFRFCFGHYNRDTSVAMTEQLAQGNLQMYEQFWNHWVNEMGLHDINESSNSAYVDGNKYRANFNFLMTWNDGGGGGAYSSSDAHGFFYAMANTTYCRFDPPSGATPHEMGHVWEGSCAGFNGSDSSGMWWEATANWMMLQYDNSYPQCQPYIYNGVFYPAHGRDYYDSWTIWEAAREDPRYGAAWVNSVWTNATASQKVSEYIIDRMIRVDTSGSADKAGAVKDLWGDMAKKMITWDFERQRWLATVNAADDGSNWEFYQRTRTPLVKIAGTTGLYRPCREYTPEEFGFNFIPLAVTAGTTVSCNFQPVCDPVRQSDWRACLVAVNNSGEARYSCLWNRGTNSITLSADEGKLYLVVIATPKPMKVSSTNWQMYMTDNGLQFPFVLSFTNATPKNVIYPVQSHTGMTQHANGGGWKATTATVDATAYIGPNAQVLNTAQVRGYARIEDYAVVRNTAQVRDYAVVSGHAEISANAKVYGNAKVRDWARIYGYAEVYENAKAIEHAYCGDGNSTTHNKILGSAIIKGVTSVYDTSTFTGCLICDGDTANGNGSTTADKGVHFGWAWGQDPTRFTQLTDNGYVYAQHDFERDNPIFALDKYGINSGFLMNGARAGKDTVAPTRGGRVLPLDGVSQYVELHNSVNDFRETAICLWVKWTGSAADQRIWSMGDGAGKYMYLTPMDPTTGNLRLVISNGTTTQYLDGVDPIPGNTWTHVAVTFGSPVFNTSTSTWSATGTLYMNGSQVATLAGMIVPDALNAPLMENANYLGRGNAGNYFQGYIDDFRVYMKTLTASDISTIYNTAAPSPITITADTTAPTPNAETWLVNPAAISDSAITMSATVGTDASGWVEYYFACTSGGGHDSGWVSFNKYTDVGLSPGTMYTYTVKMRDKNGNTTAASTAQSATTQTSTAPTPSFAYGPVGIGTTSITMTATKVTSPSGLVEYKFDRTSPTAASSGWQSTSTWTNTGLSSGTSYTYTVTVRDGRGNVSAASDPVTAIARDMAAPKLAIPVAQWAMLPYATIDNKVSMTAQTPTSSDASTVQYKFFCTSGNAPDSAWQTSATYLTAALADGTYSFHYKTRDQSAQYNESDYSTTYSASITPTSGYHSYTMSQLAALSDDYLVNFTGTVMRAYTNYYSVKDMASGATMMVKPATNAEVTDPTLALKNVTVKGHLYTLAGVREVTWSTVTSSGNPTTYTISGKVTNTGGVGISGATVYFSDIANASVTYVVTATTDAGGNYSRAVTPGTWYVAAGSSAYNTSADQVVSVSTANVTGINFSLVANAKISGTVTKRSDGTAISGASVSFKTSPTAAATFTAATNASGAYTQAVQNTTWYVSVSATGYTPTPDQTVVVSGADVSNINFALKPDTRSIPRTSDLLISAITDTFPASGSTGNWASYLPSGSTLTMMGTPTVDVVNGIKWENNLKADGDGYVWGSAYSSPIAVNGASIVVAVKPNRSGDTDNWKSIVDIFYDRLCLVTNNGTGAVGVRRNGGTSWGSAIPNGQITILSLVCQPDGTYKVWANGAQIMSIASTSAMTSLVPGVVGGYASYINVGRNNPDAWSTYNGDIGDFFIYKVALTDAERQQLEADLRSKFASYAIMATAGANGSISPSGLVSMSYGDSQLFTITPNTGYAVASVVVDGVNQGAITSYTFSNVTANHTISATFSPLTYTITASAGANGSISPAGTTTKNYGTSQTYTITPNPDYAIADVKVDGVSQGAIAGYTFSNIAANHTISATFGEIVESLAELKAKPDGAWVAISGLVVTAAFDGFFYAEAPDRSMGIRVIWPNRPSVGQIVEIRGSLETNTDLERCLRATYVSGGGTSLLLPLGMNGRWLGGGGYRYSAATGAGQRGMNAWVWVKQGGSNVHTLISMLGVNNTGLLVRMWGKVGDSNGSTFLLDDGVGIDSGDPTLPGVKVVLPSGATAPSNGDIVTVNGISSCYLSGTSVFRQLLPRDAGDIRPAN